MIAFRYTVAAVDLLVLMLFAGIGLTAKPQEKETRLSCGFISVISLMNLVVITCR